MTQFETFDAILSARYSCRAFLPDAVAQDTVNEIVQAAQKVPSW